MAYWNASNKSPWANLFQDDFKWGLIRRGGGLIREGGSIISNIFHKEKAMELIIKQGN